MAKVCKVIGTPLGMGRNNFVQHTLYEVIRPAVKRFGYGYAQGAEQAAKELGLAAGSVELKYHYTGAFNADPAIETMSSAWYQSGTEVIFGCGGAVGNSVMAAAEKDGKKVIGVDVDQSRNNFVQHTLYEVIREATKMPWYIRQAIGGN